MILSSLLLIQTTIALILVTLSQHTALKRYGILSNWTLLRGKNFFVEIWELRGYQSAFNTSGHIGHICKRIGITSCSQCSIYKPPLWTNLKVVGQFEQATAWTFNSSAIHSGAILIRQQVCPPLKDITCIDTSTQKCWKSENVILNTAQHKRCFIFYIVSGENNLWDETGVLMYVGFSSSISKCQREFFHLFTNCIQTDKYVFWSSINLQGARRKMVIYSVLLFYLLLHISYPLSYDSRFLPQSAVTYLPYMMDQPCPTYLMKN